MKRQRQRRYLLVIPWVIGAMFGSGAHGQCEVLFLVDNEGLGFVSIDGDVSIVGASHAFGSLGAAFVYRRGPGGPQDWTLETTLMAPEPNTEDIFGRAVGVSGNVIVVAAHHTPAPEFNSGAAYVYRHDGETWKFEAMLSASDGEAGDIFGFSVAIDDDVILIGARDDGNNGMSQTGSAYVFRYNPDTSEWDQEAKLTDPQAEVYDLFGQSVAISGDAALVGAHANEDAGSGTGAAFVFRYSKGAARWVLEQQLQAFDAQWSAKFGFSVSLIDNKALIGAHYDDGQTGAAYVMRYEGTRWVHEAKLVASNPVGPFPLMGTSVSLNRDGLSALVGAPLDNEAGNQAGAAHLFRSDGQKWQEIVKLTSSDPTPGSDFGEAVALDDDLALILSHNGAVVYAGMQSLDCNENGEPDACDIFDGTSDDQDTNGIPDECESIPGDINGDGVVGAADLLILLVNWGRCGDCDDCPADLDQNCTVGASDLLILLANWG